MFIWRKLVSDPLLKIAKKRVPPMSDTEREAIEAGTVGWDADLFSGKPDWNKLLSFPSPTLSPREQAFLDGPVDELCRMLDDWKINEELHDLPPEVWKFIKDQGFFGMIIPKEYGGLEFSAIAHSTVITKIISRSLVATVTIMVPNSLGPAELLLRYGKDSQKQYYLPRLARGEEVPCFALTSPTAGSDAASMTDAGVVCRGEFDGKKDVLGIRLSWEKRYITLAPIATVLGLAFKLYDPDHLLGEKEELGITLALIPTKTPGVNIGRRHSPLGISFMNGPTSGEDVFIPMDWVIGGQEWVGQGWRMLMDCLAAGRSISLPALGTGAGKLASRSVGAYASIRKQFKTPIGQFEGVEEALARIGGYTYLMDAARVMTAGAVDQGEQPSVISAIVKYHLTETMRRVLNDAMDVLGGRGIVMGPRNFLGRIYQAIPISITVEGANILTRSLIIFGQGAIRCHPWVLKEMEALSDPDPQRSSKDFEKALSGHMRFFMGNAFRSFWCAISGARFVNAPGNHPSQRYYQNFSRMSAAFALLADTAMMILGGALKRKERLSARLGDILSYLYLGSACLKRFEDQERPKEDIPFLEWGCDTCLHRIQQRLDQLIRSFPNRLAAWFLRKLIFPLGLPFKAPSDRTVQRVARLLLKPSSARDRLTAGTYLSTDPTDPTGRLEVALMKMVEAESAEKKLKNATRTGKIKASYGSSLMETAIQQGIITQEEAALINAAEEARKDVIKVDDFPSDYWSSLNK